MNIEDLDPKTATLDDYRQAWKETYPNGYVAAEHDLKPEDWNWIIGLTSGIVVDGEMITDCLDMESWSKEAYWSFMAHVSLENAKRM